MISYTLKQNVIVVSIVSGLLFVGMLAYCCRGIDSDYEDEEEEEEEQEEGEEEEGKGGEEEAEGEAQEAEGRTEKNGASGSEADKDEEGEEDGEADEREVPKSNQKTTTVRAALLATFQASALTFLHRGGDSRSPETRNVQSHSISFARSRVGRDRADTGLGKRGNGVWLTRF